MILVQDEQALITTGVLSSFLCLTSENGNRRGYNI